MPRYQGEVQEDDGSRTLDRNIYIALVIVVLYIVVVRTAVRDNSFCVCNKKGY